jgi:GNAT superfamily N-acetyltransferase
MIIQPYETSFQPWAADLLTEEWGSNLVVSRGQIHDALRLPGFVAVLENTPVGLVTYRLGEGECELITINALRSGLGIGTALLGAVKEVAIGVGCRRLWLVTTNDNVDALRFYQVRGFQLVALHRNALESSRRLKPEIPAVGQHGIPLRDEIELELILADLQ